MNLKNLPQTWRVGSWALLVIVVSILTPASQAAEVKQVAIFPFAINAPERMDYLKEGVHDMFASRLTWEDRVVVLDKARVQKVLEKISGPMDEARAIELGKQLKADVVLWGSINVLGTSVSLDINVLDVSPSQAVKKFYVQAKGIDEVIVKVDELTDMINEKVFNRARTTPTREVVTTAPQTKGLESSREPASSGKPPLDLKALTINPVSPQIIISSGGIDMAGTWRSSILPFAVVDMAFGDLDGDGKIETVLISKNRIYIYRYTQDKFQMVKEIHGGRWDNFISVDVADINGTGFPQIFVTNFREDGLKSLTLSWVKGDYKKIAENIPYHLRVHQLPGRGTVLLGQQKFGGEPFDSKIVILSWKEGKYIPVERVRLPEGLTVFNFAFLEDSKDGHQEIMYLNSSKRLTVVSEKGKAIFSSSNPYGGTINLLPLPEGNKPPGQDYDEKDRVFIPSRLIVTSVSNPGKKEIILNRNKGSVLNFLARYQAYTSGEIFSLSWDGGTLKENWKTPVINDYISNYGVADFKNNGQKQLVVGVVQSSGVALISNARSLLICYDLGAINPKAN